MANTESDRKEKGTEVLGETALDGIAGGGGEGMEAGLNLGDVPGGEEIAKRLEMIEQWKKFQEDIVKKI
jgi:hypothetical protein